MFTVIRSYFRKLNSDSLAQYYQDRLEQTKSPLELEAIAYTQSLVSLYELSEEEKSSEPSKN